MRYKQTKSALAFCRFVQPEGHLSTNQEIGVRIPEWQQKTCCNRVSGLQHVFIFCAGQPASILSGGITVITPDFGSGNGGSIPSRTANTNMADGGTGLVPKSSMVTTHTARRSAATNLLLDGVPISEIMQLGGWKNESTLKHYLLAGGIQLARLSADRDFFK